MIRPEVLRKRLNKLDEYLSILHKLQRYSYDEFIGDAEHYGSAERFLHLAIEAVIDMGNHVVAELDLGVINWYSDIPRMLAANGYLTSALEEKWIQMIGFRNALVHDYTDIDRKVVYDILQNNIDDLKDLRKVFANFI